MTLGALEQLEVEMEEERGVWVSREEEVRETCARIQTGVQEKTYVYSIIRMCVLCLLR